MLDARSRTVTTGSFSVAPAHTGGVLLRLTPRGGQRSAPVVAPCRRSYLDGRAGPTTVPTNPFVAHVAGSDSFRSPPGLGTPTSRAPLPAPAGPHGAGSTHRAPVNLTRFRARANRLCVARENRIRAWPASERHSLATLLRIDETALTLVRALRAVSAPADQAKAYRSFLTHAGRLDELRFKSHAAQAAHRTAQLARLRREIARLSRSYALSKAAAALGLPACARNPTPSGPA